MVEKGTVTKMEAYTDFASVYDTFMDETPYEEWAEFLHNLIKEYGISEPVRSGKTEATAETNDASTASDKEEILDSEKNLVLESVFHSLHCLFECAVLFPMHHED